MNGEHANGVGLSVIHRQYWVTQWVLSYPTVNMSGEHGRCRVIIIPKGKWTQRVLSNPKGKWTRQVLSNPKVNEPKR